MTKDFKRFRGKTKGLWEEEGNAIDQEADHYARRLKAHSEGDTSSRAFYTQTHDEKIDKDLRIGDTCWSLGENMKTWTKIGTKEKVDVEPYKGSEAVDKKSDRSDKSDKSTESCQEQQEQLHIRA